MTIYVLTFKATAQHDAERRAGLNRFLKAALRAYGLRLVRIETKEQEKPHSVPNVQEVSRDQRPSRSR
jgi:hypothetical protein